MDLSSEIAAVYQRALFLRQCATESPVETDLVEAALKELLFVLEELQTNQEELRSQNQELIATRYSLEVERQRYKSLFELAPDGYLVTDRQGRIHQANRAAAHIFSTPGEYLINKPLVVLVHKFEHSLFQARLLNLNAVQDWEVSLHTGDGTIRTVALCVTHLKGASEEQDKLLWSVRDITTKKQMEQLLRASEEQFRQFAIHIDAVLWIASVDFLSYLYVSPAYEAIWGRSEENLYSRTSSWLEAVHLDDRARVASYMSEPNSAKTTNIEYRIVRPDGEIRWIWEKRFSIPDRTGKISCYGGLSTDISDRKQADVQIQQLAYYDPLTNLPNRRLLYDRLEKTFSLAKRSGHYGTLLFIDLDHFKTINDACGHEMGDFLLSELAIRLKSCLREADTVARLGGDEFVVLLSDLSYDSEVAIHRCYSVERKIRANLSTPIILGGKSIRVTLSIGITVFPKGAETVHDLLKEADTAMYEAKAEGGNKTFMFESKMQIDIESRFTLETEIQCGLEEKQFRIFLQPQVDGAGSLVGAEALIRWQHPQQGLLSPSAFIGVAEETGLIVAIDEWVLWETCYHLARIQSAGSSLRLSVNLSPGHFRQNNFVSLIKSILAATGADPNYLTLEVTESILIQDIEQAIVIMLELKALGILFSLDDFGTGYSSLAYLKRLPLNELKIDKIFIQDALENPNDAALVEAIIAVANRFNLAIVAEGVETQEQADFLKARGCHFYQGYLYGRPIPMLEFFERSPAIFYDSQ
ncbi:MAG: hypothetical protein N5P05_001604 [Chroococcopsis gigantea SAG 12.99]|nr:hypothetical protein [Chroococcopsis gigantea SAG 12.99]